MDKKKWVLALLLAIFSPALSAQTVSRYTLAECVAYATDHSYSMKSARIDEEVADKYIREVRSSALPQVNAYGSFDYNLKIASSVLNVGEDSVAVIKLGTKYSATGYVQWDQTLYDGSFWTGLKAAKISRLYYNQSTKQAVQNVMYQVGKAYYQALVDAKKVNIQQSNWKKTQELLATTELQFQQGVATKTDRDKVLVDYNNLLSDLRDAQRTAVKSLHQLKFEMGMPIRSELFLVDVTTDPTAAYHGVDTTHAESYRNRLDYQLLQTTDELRLLDVQKSRKSYQPTLTAYAKAQTQGLRNEFDFFQSNQRWFPSQVVGLKLTIPIFDGFKKSAQIQQGKLKIEKNQVEIAKLEQNIHLEVENALADFASSLQSLADEKRNLDLADEVHQTTQLAYQQGTGSYNDLVDADNSLQKAQTNYVSSLLNIYLAKVELLKAQGNLINLTQ